MLNRKKIIFLVIIGLLIGLWAGSDALLAQYVTSTLPPPPPPPVNNGSQPTIGPAEAEKVNRTAKKLAIISLCLYFIFAACSDWNVRPKILKRVESKEELRLNVNK